MSDHTPSCPICKRRCEVHAGVYICAPCHWFGGLVGALGVPSPEKASDGPATPTDPCPDHYSTDHPNNVCSCEMYPTLCHAPAHCRTCGKYLEGGDAERGRAYLDSSRCFECADDGP